MWLEVVKLLSCRVSRRIARYCIILQCVVLVNPKFSEPGAQIVQQCTEEGGEGVDVTDPSGCEDLLPTEPDLGDG